MSDFQDGLAAVGLNDKYGFIDTRGNPITGLIYDKVGDFVNGFAPVYQLISSDPPGPAYLMLGYIDTKGIRYWED